jgi:hypothetical protein
MVHITQIRWDSGPYTSSGIPNKYETTFRIHNLFPSSGEGRDTPTLLAPCSNDLR